MVNAKIGTNLDGGSGSSQIGTGNISGMIKLKVKIMLPFIYHLDKEMR